MERYPFFCGYYRSENNDEFCSNDDFSPNEQPMDSLADFELSQEEDLYFDDMMRQPREIDEIMNKINTQLAYLYNELQRNRINRSTARYLFRTIASFVLNNASKYTGTPQQRTIAILRDFRRRYPWVFFIMRSFGLPVMRVEEIVRTVISFVLANIGTKPVPTETVDQRADRIVNLIRNQTDVFRNLKSFNLPDNRAVNLVRKTVLFVLRNTNINIPPTNIQDRAQELLRQLERNNPDIINDLKRFRIPDQQIINILRTIIVFTLRSLFMREDW